MSSELDEEVDHLRIERSPRFLLEQQECRLVRHRLVIGALGGQCVEVVDHGEDTRAERDVVAGDAVLLLEPEKAATLSLNLSVGIAELARGDSALTWLQRADQALYAAKQAGGGRVSVA